MTGLAPAGRTKPPSAHSGSRFSVVPGSAAEARPAPPPTKTRSPEAVSNILNSLFMKSVFKFCTRVGFRTSARFFPEVSAGSSITGRFGTRYEKTGENKRTHLRKIPPENRSSGPSAPVFTTAPSQRSRHEPRSRKRHRMRQSGLQRTASGRKEETAAARQRWPRAENLHAKQNIPVGKSVFPVAGKVIDGLLT